MKYLYVIFELILVIGDWGVSGENSLHSKL